MCIRDSALFARALVRALAQIDNQFAREARANVLDLAHDAIALGIDVELGGLGSAIRDLECRRACFKLGLTDLACAVGCIHGNVAARGGIRRTAREAEREDGQDANERARAVSYTHLR